MHILESLRRDYRKLWIARINAAASNGISYSKLINGLKLSGIEITRKMLSELAINDAAAFTKLSSWQGKAMRNNTRVAI